MIKLAVAGITLSLLVLLSSSYADAQELSANTSKKTFSGSEISDTAQIRYRNDVSGRVLRSFHQTFGDKAGTIWSKTADNLFIAFYKENNKANYVYFSNSGAIDYTLSRYGEDELSKDIRHLVKSNFYEYDIINVSEVHKNDSVLFFVTVMNKASVKLIRVNKEDWEIIKDLIRK